MRFFAILSDSLRVFASFTYCEYTRASPNTLFPIIADYRRVSLILLYFMSGYLVFLLGHPLCYPHTSATLPLLLYLPPRGVPFIFSYHFIFFSEICGHSRILLKHFLFSNSSLFSIKTPCNSTVKKNNSYPFTK